MVKVDQVVKVAQVVRVVQGVKVVKLVQGDVQTVQRLLTVLELVSDPEKTKEMVKEDAQMEDKVDPVIFKVDVLTEGKVVPATAKENRMDNMDKEDRVDKVDTVMVRVTVKEAVRTVDRVDMAKADRVDTVMTKDDRLDKLDKVVSPDKVDRVDMVMVREDKMDKVDKATASVDVQMELRVDMVMVKMDKADKVDKAVKVDKVDKEVPMATVKPTHIITQTATVMTTTYQELMCILLPLGVSVFLSFFYHTRMED